MRCQNSDLSRERAAKSKRCQGNTVWRETGDIREKEASRQTGGARVANRKGCQQMDGEGLPRGRCETVRTIFGSAPHLNLRFTSFQSRLGAMGRMALWRRSTLRWGLEPQDPAANSHEPYILPNTQIYLTSYRRFCILQYRFYSFWNVRPRLAGHYLYTKCEYGEVCSNTAIVSNASMCPMFQSFLVVLEPYLN